MPKARPASRTALKFSVTTTLNPTTYRALKTEQGVFTTPPYSGELKGLWKFKDADAARESSTALWERFKGFKEQGDFVGMDITRKFIQMGRTRSLRYALRKGGRKYEQQGRRKRKATEDDGEEEDEMDKRAGRKEIPRTGEVYDESKLEGANVFEGYLHQCWADKVYTRAWEDWREASKKADREKAETEPEKKSQRRSRG